MLQALALLRGSNKVVLVYSSTKFTNSMVMINYEVKENDFILIGVLIVRSYLVVKLLA